MLPFSEKSALTIALLSTFLAGIGDVFLLYHPAANYPDGRFLFMQDIGRERLLIGHYLGLVFIPLYIFGFYFVYQLFEKKSPQLAKFLFLASTLLLFPGVAYHTYCSAVALSVKKYLANGGQPDLWDKNLEGLRIFFEPMAVIFVIGFILFSVILAREIWRNKSELNRNMAFFNPLLFYLVFILLHLFYPPVGNAFLVAGFNWSLFLFFLALALQRKIF